MSRRHEFAEPEPPTGAASELGGNRATDREHPCPGPCNHAFRAAEQAAIDETLAAKAEERLTDRSITDHDTPFHPGRPVWCVDVPAFNHKGEALDKLAHHGCHETIVTRLRDLGDLATALAPGRLNTPRNADIDKSSSKGGGAKALSHAPSPSPGWDTADELIRWLVDLEDWLRALVGDDIVPGRVRAVLRVREHHLPPGASGPVGPANGYPVVMTDPTANHRTLSAALGYLAGHEVALLASPDAERIGHDILTQHRRLQHLAGLDRLVHRIPEPCPLCNRKGLRRADGDELVKCRSCRATWDWDHFQMLCRTYADDVKANPKGASA